MVAREKRAMVQVLSYGQVMEEVKRDLPRLVAGQVVKFPEPQSATWFGGAW